MTLLAIAMTALLSNVPVLADPLRYMEAQLKVRTKDAQLVRFRLNGVQREVERQKAEARAAGKPARYLILKSRQCGVSTLEVAHNFHRTITRKYTRCLTLAHKKAVADVLFRTANTFWDHLNPLLRPRRLAPHNQRTLDLPGLSSLFNVHTSKDVTAGRGDTINRVQWSEAAYTPGGEDEHAKLLTSLELAAKRGEIVMESTANGYGNLFEKLCSDAMKGIGEWTLIFVPWWFDADNHKPVTPEEATAIMTNLSREEAILVEKHRLKPEQIAWRRAENATAEKRRDFSQEYPEDEATCFLTSGTSYFDIQQVDLLLKSLPENDGTVKQLAGGVEIRWEEPQSGVEYVAGADTSEGVPGCDPNGIGILRRDTGAMVASIHGLFDPADLADHCCRISKAYNEALLGVERNNHGHAVLLKIASLGYGRSHTAGGALFHFTKAAGGAAKPGWDTNTVTRPLMLAGLREVMDEEALGIRDRLFLQECRTFRKQSNGKFEADSGKHDDAVMKWAIAVQMLRHRKYKPAMPFYRKLGI